MLIWLKKSTAENVHKNKFQIEITIDQNLLLTATHSFKSSPSGNITANLKFPEPKVAAACFINSY